MFDASRKSLFQMILFVFGGMILLYAIIVLVYSSSSYEIGIRSLLSPHIIGKPRSEKEGENKEGLRPRDKIVKIGDLDIERWSQLLQAPARIKSILQNHSSWQSLPWVQIDPNTDQIFIRVEFERLDHDKVTRHTTWCEIRRTPLDELVPSLLWLFLKGGLFVVGALVYWKRPQDEAALRFYILCVFNLGAYIGGYHWSQILTQPVLLLVFMVCAILMPVSCLHFYLVFPHKKRWLAQYPRQMLLAIYGIPFCTLAGLFGFYVYIRMNPDSDYVLTHYLPWMIYLSFAVCVLWYGACNIALIHSLWSVQDPMELKQVKCVLFGIVLSLIPIAFSLYIVLADPDAFAEGAVTWPMFGASVLVTLAFVIGMTRYRLMELNTIINSSLGYFFVSFLAGLLYYGVVFIGTLFYSRFITSPTLPAALAVSTTALLFVVILDLARSRIKNALDRRFSRNKSQLDHTLQQMGHAVSHLVDPPELAQRLLATIGDTLGVNRGAVYLRHQDSSEYRLVASRGAAPILQEFPAGFPLVEALKNGLGLEIPALSEGAGTQAQQQLHALGAEVAQPLMHDSLLLAILILGPKETPYRTEDWTLLSAFAQITVVALESAVQHRTIENLHGELQVKVDKIAEQQRRIMTLQTQLHRQTSAEKIVHRIDAADKQPALTPLANGDASATTATGIVGSSAVIHQLLNIVRKVAATDAVVLLRGESGTGKELLARAVHESSPRAAKPYVKVHCAALSPSLLESELFGHVKGAFTGAHRDKIGRFELAGGGTLFLDEIGDISLDVQIKLLRVLQEKSFERVGSSETVQSDVRIIAATHQNLEDLIDKARFREDLFYRLNVFPIHVPALRERREDIAELVMHFVQEASKRSRKNLLHIEDEAMAALKGYDWPGNIRELENIIERAVVVAEGDTLTINDLPPEIFQAESLFQDGNAAHLNGDGAVDIPASSFRSERDRFEREQLLRVLTSANGNKSEAARLLGVARSTLVSRMKKLGLV